MLLHMCGFVHKSKYFSYPRHSQEPYLYSVVFDVYYFVYLCGNLINDGDFMQMQKKVILSEIVHETKIMGTL